MTIFWIDAHLKVARAQVRGPRDVAAATVMAQVQVGSRWSPNTRYACSNSREQPELRAKASLRTTISASSWQAAAGGDSCRTAK